MHSRIANDELEPLSSMRRQGHGPRPALRSDALRHARGDLLVSVPLGNKRQRHAGDAAMVPPACASRCCSISGVTPSNQLDAPALATAGGTQTTNGAAATTPSDAWRRACKPSWLTPRKRPPHTVHACPMSQRRRIRSRRTCSHHGSRWRVLRRGQQPTIEATDPSGCTVVSSTNRPEHDAFRCSPVEAMA
ncbi:hypothetical protein D1007_03217 [Hordeum vulgare]|nr:hypothetical protein D1007_03217 [Hordeum vulgare]